MSATHTAKYGSAEWCWFRSAKDALLDQVEQRKEEDPDQVDEVPVQARQLDAQVVVRAVVAPPGAEEDHGEHGHPRQDVEAVQAGHQEVEGPVHRGAGQPHLLEM